MVPIDHAPTVESNSSTVQGEEASKKETPAENNDKTSSTVTEFDGRDLSHDTIVLFQEVTFQELPS